MTPEKRIEKIEFYLTRSKLLFQKIPKLSEQERCWKWDISESLKELDQLKAELKEQGVSDD